MHSEHARVAAEVYFNGSGEVRVRRLSFADVERVASGDTAGSFAAYMVEGDTVRPISVVLDATPEGNVVSHPTYAVDPDTGRLDRTVSVGRRITAFVYDGTMAPATRLHWFSSKEAERASAAYSLARGDSDAPRPSEGRKAIWLPLDSPALGSDSTGKIATKRLAPFHGTRVTVSFVAKGYSPDDIEDEVRRFLGGRVGSEVIAFANVEPVRDVRANLVTADGEVVHTNILEAEAQVLAQHDFTLSVVSATEDD